MLASKASLRASKKPTRAPHPHTKQAATANAISMGYSTDPYKGMCLESDTDEHTALARLYEVHKGNLQALAAAVQCKYPQYHLSEAKLKAKAPTSSKQFAWQCVEGYYLTDCQAKSEIQVDSSKRKIVLQDLARSQLNASDTHPLSHHREREKEKEKKSGSEPASLIPSAYNAIVPFSHASPFTDKLKLKKRLFTICGRHISIEQSWKPDGKGGSAIGFGASVYDASFVLADYLERCSTNTGHSSSSSSSSSSTGSSKIQVHGKSVCELGCGLGLVSLACVLIGAHTVVATDGDDELLKKTKKIAQANLNKATGTNTADALSSQKEMSRLHIQRLWWGNKEDEQKALNVLSDTIQKTPDSQPSQIDPKRQKFDLVVASDIAALPYKSDLLKLVRTIRVLTSEAGICVIAYKARAACEDAFFTVAKKYFEMTEVENSELHPDFHTGDSCGATIKIIIMRKIKKKK